MSTPKDLNILIVGVGGQGTILAGRVLANLAQKLGLDVKVSEIHGMAQRGGSVVTQVRLGQKVAAPIIIPGQVDYILAFEQLEALRWSPWLREGGLMIANTQCLDPMPVLTGQAQYPENIPEKLDVPTVFLDAYGLAKEAGSAKAINIVLLGLFSQYLDVDRDLWQQAIADAVPAKHLELNLKAFSLGVESYQK